MERSRIGIMGIAAAMLSAIGSHGLVRGGISRVTSDSKAGRQTRSVATPRHRSKYMPHIGKKEQERAKRCYMVNTFGGTSNPYNKNRRSAPTLAQSARRVHV